MIFHNQKKHPTHYRLIALILCACFIFTSLYNSNVHASSFPQGICISHLTHDESCGFVAEVPGSPCTHEHNDDCYITNCIIPEEEQEGHICSVDSGCITLNCTHEHNGECGYVKEVKGSPCTHFCEYCVSLLSDEPDEDPHVRYEDSTFDITVRVSEDFWEYNITELPVNVYLKGHNDPIETTLKITNKVISTGYITGTIEKIPVYYRQSTGNIQLGYTGEYKTDDDFYRVEVPDTIQDGMYTLSFDAVEGNDIRGTKSAYVSLYKPKNDLVWSGTLLEYKEEDQTRGSIVPDLNITERDVKPYNLKVMFLGDTPVKSYPFSTGESGEDTGIYLTYTENEKDFRLFPIVSEIADSAYDVLFPKVPISDEINETLKIHIPEYTNGKNDFFIYRDNGVDSSKEPPEPLYAEVSKNTLVPFGGSNNFQTISYIQKTDLSGTIQWMDDGGIYDTPQGVKSYRPGADAIRDMIHVYTTASDSEIDRIYNTVISDLSVQSPPRENAMGVSITGLPMYKPDGAVLHYYYKIGNGGNIPAVEEASEDDAHSYSVRYDNGTASASSTQAYDGATIYLALTKAKPQYKINVKWMDDEFNNPTNLARARDVSDVALYLWRYAGDESSAAAVYDDNGNQYSVRINSTEDIEIDFQNDNKYSFFRDLPSYNENGRAYHYYLTAINKGTGYSVSYTGGKPYVTNGESIILSRVGSDAFSARVLWKAAGEKDYIGTKSVLVLQRRLKDSDNSNEDWEDVEEARITTPAIPDNINFVEGTFPYVDLYVPASDSTIENGSAGKSYDFRVVERKMIPTGLEEALDGEIDDPKIISIPKDSWQDASPYSPNMKAQSVQLTYMNHGYEIVSNYKYSFNESTLSPSYDFLITNTLHEDVNYTLRIYWPYSPSDYDTDYYKNQLALLLAKQAGAIVEGEGENQFTYEYNYSGADLSWIISRQEYVKTGINSEVLQTMPYLRISVGSTKENGEIPYSVEYLNNNENRTPFEGIVSVTDEIDKSSGKATGQSWRFSGFKVAKYDENGRKYAYNVDEDDTSSNNRGDHHELVSHMKNKYNRLGIFIEKSVDAINNAIVVSHKLLPTGRNYYAAAIATWDDNLTDRSLRKIDVHVVGYTIGSDGKKHLFMDLGDPEAPLYAPGLRAYDPDSTGKMQLNNENEFKYTRYFAPITDTELAKLYPDGDITITQDDIYYTSVEVAISYRDHTYNLSWLNSDGTLNEALITKADAVGNPSYDIPIVTSGDSYPRIVFYPYTVNTQSDNAHVRIEKNGESRSFHTTRTVHHKLGSVLGNVKAKITWEDDSNSSGYRKDAYQLELHREKNGISEAVYDKDGNPVVITLKWSDYIQEDGKYSSEQTVEFPGEYEIYDNQGNPYTYSIRQYICELDDEGNVKNDSKSQIMPNATESTTQNRYITRWFYRSVPEINSSGEYRNNYEFEITNSAANRNYDTSFFVVWHDEAAYKAKSRSDMQYSLYYTLGDEDPITDRKPYNLSDYSLTIETAERIFGGLGQNPYFQEISVSGLKEFHTIEDGNARHTKKVHYYIEERKTDSSESFYAYKISYYRLAQDPSKGDENTLKKAVSVSGFINNILGSLGYYHRSFDDNVMPNGINDTTKSLDPDERAVCFIGEKEVIINSIEAKLKIQGTKKWVNMAEGAEKPKCTIYLFRDSTYDDGKKIPPIPVDENLKEEQVSDSTKYVAKTGLVEGDDGQDKFSFREDEDDPESELIDYEKFDSYGSAYNYDIAEIIKTVDGKAVSSSVMHGTSDGGLQLVNTYDPKKSNQRSFVIRKTWEYENDEDSTLRPVSRYFVYRMECNYKDTIDGVEQYPIANSVDPEKVKEAINKPSNQSYAAYLKSCVNSANNPYKVELITTVSEAKSGKTQEIATIKEQKVYAPNGNPYVYFVVEDAEYVPSYKVSIDQNKDGYAFEDNVVMVDNSKIDDTAGVAAIYAGASNRTTVGFINTHKYQDKFIQIQGTLSWVEGSTNIRNAVRPILNTDDIRLTLQRSAVTQPDLSGNNKNPINTEVIKFEGSSDNYIPKDNIVWSDNGDGTWTYTITGSFPNFAKNGEPYTYIVHETLISGSNTQKNYSITANSRSRQATVNSIIKVDDKDTLKITQPITNSLKGTYTVQKNWVDGYDSYGLRPQSVEVMFQYKAPEDTTWKALRYDSGVAEHQEGEILTLTLSKANGWSQSLQRFPITGYKYRVVERALGYQSGNKVYVSRVPFEDGDYALAEYGTVPKTDSFGSLSTYGSYRVYPVDVEGVSFESSNTKISEIKNQLDQSTDLILTKKWEDDGDKFGQRPDSINLVLQKRQYQKETTTWIENGTGNWEPHTETTNVDGAWVDASDAKITLSKRMIEAGVKTGVAQLLDDGNTWQYTYKNLPVTDEMGYKYQYRMFEVADDKTELTDASIGADHPIGDYHMSDYSSAGENSFTVNITNTLVSSRSLTVNKQWIDDKSDADSPRKSHMEAVVKYAADDSDTDVRELTVEADISGDGPFTWSMIPDYITTSEGNKYFKELSLKETGVNSAEVNYDFALKNGKSVGTAVDSDNKKWLVEITDNSSENNFSYNVTNTLLKSHTINVSYSKDSASNEKYKTRPESALLKLQYKTEDALEWSDIGGDFEGSLLSTVKHNNISVSDAKGKEGLPNGYKYTEGDLPAYSSDGKAYNYRLIETKAGAINVNYVNPESEAANDKLSTSLLTLAKVDGSKGADTYGSDRAVGGYTYAYTDVDEETNLTKSLLTVKVSGNKIWDDWGDKYKMRPDIPDSGQSDEAKVSVYKGVGANPTDVTEHVSISWSATDDSNKWAYATNDDLLPKYISNSQMPETYTVKETSVGKSYTAKYGEDKTSAIKAPDNSDIGVGDKANYSLSDITNEVSRVDVKLKKVWADTSYYEHFGIEPVSATYVIQVSTNGTSFTDLQETVDGKTAPVSETIEYTDTGIHTLASLPATNRNGDVYTYRVVESAIKTRIKDESGTSFEETFAIDSEAIGSLFGNESYTHKLGIFKASMTHSGEVFTYTNTPYSVSAGANINWHEYLNGQSSNDETLTNNFRPEKISLKLQRRVADSDGATWEDVTNTITGGDYIDVTFGKEDNTKSVNVTDKISASKLPMYVIVEGNLKEYEYRLVEDNFTYSAAQTGSDEQNRPLIYESGNSADYTDGKLSCKDSATANDVFYKGVQSNGKTDNAQDNVQARKYTSTITNTLQTSALINQVKVDLEGKITWLDNNNELGKRPENGITFTLRGQPAGGSEFTKDVVIGNDDSGSVTVSGLLTGLNSDVILTLTWTKESNDSAEDWTYKLEGLPLYDKSGHYITYSINQKTNPKDYKGEPVATDTSGHKAESGYAFGNVTDIINNYDVATGKNIKFVDFEERMFTTLTVKKNWEDGVEPWKTRPNTIHIMIQSRDVSGKNSDAINAMGVRDGWREEHTSSLTVPTGDNYKEVTVDHTKNINTWSFELPQYEVSKSESSNVYKLIEYRGVELAQTANNGPYVLVDGIDQIIRDSNNVITSETPHVGSYYLTNYYINWNGGYVTSAIENTLDKREDIIVKKEWNTDGETIPTSVTVDVVGFVKENHASTEVTVEHARMQKELTATGISGDDNSSEWQYIYKDLPKYDLNFNQVLWEVREVKVGSVNVEEVELLSGDKAGRSVDGNWLATYEKTINEHGSENDEITLTVTNTPAVKAELNVTYKDDIENAYYTRANTTKATLQSRRLGSSEESEWVDVTGDLTGLIIKVNNLALSSQKITLNCSNSDNSANYSYVLNNIPVYSGFGATRGGKLEYRLIETGQDELNVTQGSPSGGYEYEYTSLSTLEKTLLKVNIEGTKTWIDESNEYSTRANFTAKGEDNEVEIIVKEASTNVNPQPEITWSNHSDSDPDTVDSDIWDYSSSYLPKYKAHTDTLASYSVAENYVNQQYESEISGYSIKNKLKSRTVVVNKVWRNVANSPAYNVDYKLSESVSGGEFEDASLAYRTKTVNKDSDNQSVVWKNLPIVKSDGSPIVYKVTEVTVNDGYKVEAASPEVLADTTTHTFYNIELQDYKAIKVWDDMRRGISDDGAGNYKSHVILQEKIGSASFIDSTNPDYAHEFVVSYDDIAASSHPTEYSQEYTFTKLPMFKANGDRIYYQIREDYINNIKTEDNPSYKVEYDHKDSGDESLVTNSLREVRVHITKKDGGNPGTANADKKAMAGIRFTLTKQNDPNGLTYTDITDENGEISFDVMELGTYLLTEERSIGFKEYAPKSYTFTESNYFIHGQNNTVEINVENERKLGKLTIYKKSGDGDDALDNAKFALYKESDSTGFSKLWDFLTGNRYTKIEANAVKSAGVTTIENIPWGEYYIVEEQADGHILSDEKYYFSVNKDTVEGEGLQLEVIDGESNKSDVGGNIIRNYKNSFTFKNVSVNGTDYLSDGVFVLSKVLDNGSREKVREFTVSDAAAGVVFEGITSGSYVISQNSAKSGYKTYAEEQQAGLTPASDNEVPLYIGTKGEIQKSKGGSDWDGNVVVFKNMPYASLKVDKSFTGDESFKEAMRPKNITFNLYSYPTGENYDLSKSLITNKEINVSANQNSYSYTFENLPMYTMDGSQALSYKAEENAQKYYTVTESNISGSALPGVTYTESIINEFTTDIKTITIKKTVENTGAAKEFDFNLYLGTDEDSLVKTKSFKLSAVNVSGEIIYVPANSEYRIEEIIPDLNEDTPVYTVSIAEGESSFTKKDVVMNDGNGVFSSNEYTADVDRIITFKNKKNVFTSIDNESTDSSNENAPIINGTVSVKVLGGGTVEDNGTGSVEPQENGLEVSWKPSDYWRSDASFEIEYKGAEVGVAEDGVVTVTDFMDETGIKDREDPCYDDLRRVYSEFDISYDSSTQNVILALKDSVNGLPYLNEVKVNFLPTAAVINTTEGYKNGTVSIGENTPSQKASGKRNYSEDKQGEEADSGEERYSNKNSVIVKAVADSGYCIDINSIQIENVDDIIDDNLINSGDASSSVSDLTSLLFSPLKVYAASGPAIINGNTLTKTLNYEGVDVNVTGIISAVNDDEGRPKEMVITFNELPVPIDVGIKFIKSEKKVLPIQPEQENSDGDDSVILQYIKNLKSPKTWGGEESELYRWILLFVAGVASSVYGITSWYGRMKKKHEENKEDGEDSDLEILS